MRWVSYSTPCGGTIESIAYVFWSLGRQAFPAPQSVPKGAADEQLAPFGIGELMKRAFLREDAVRGIRPTRDTRSQTGSFPIPPPGHTVQRA